MIERLTGFPKNVVAFLLRGWVTKADYDAILTPAVMEALELYANVRLYYETGIDFVGIEPAAMSEDFMLGMQEFERWERVALVTDSKQINRVPMPSSKRIF